MPVGDLVAWTDQTAGLATRMNKCTVISGSGTYLATLDKNQFKLFHCTADGDEFLKDHLYLIKGDGSAAIDLSGIELHTHESDSDGGSYIHLYQGMAESIDSFDPHNLNIADWTEVSAGSGSTLEVSDDATFADNKILKLSTGATISSGASLRIGSIEMAFSRESGFIALMKLEQTTDTASKWGFGMEGPTAADDNARKHGLIHCTSVNNNWFGRTADGDSRSDSDTGSAIDASKRFIQSICIPNVSEINTPHGTPFQNTFLDGDLILSKTNDIPINGQGQRAQFWRFALKNNTGVNKTSLLYKVRWTYMASEWWGSGELVD